MSALISSQFDNWKAHASLFKTRWNSDISVEIWNTGFAMFDLASIRCISHENFKSGEPLDKTTTSLCNLSTVGILALF